MALAFTSGGGGSGGGVQSVTAGDTSIVVGGTAPNPTVETGTLDLIAADHPPVGAVAVNGQKITGLANGSAPTDAAAFGQLPTVFPGQEIGYAAITSSVSVTDTSESTATALISSGDLSFDGAPVIAEFFSPKVVPPATVQGGIVITLFEGATQIGRFGQILNSLSGLSDAYEFFARYRFTPSAGTHTYKLCAWVTSTTGTPQIVAGPAGTAAYMPAFLRFTKV